MNKPTRGQVYEYSDHDGRPARLVVMSVTKHDIGYRFLNWDGSLGSYPHVITRRAWKQANIKFVDTMPLQSEVE